MTPHFLFIIKHDVNIIINLNIHKSQGVEGEGSQNLFIKSKRELTPNYPSLKE